MVPQVQMNLRTSESHPDLSEKTIWNIVQGLPLSLQTVSGELLQAYKCCAAEFLNLGIPKLEILSSLKLTLTRVLSFLGKTSGPSSGLHGDIITLLQLCIEHSPKDILLPLGLLTLEASAFLGKEKDHIHCTRLLQTLLHKLQDGIQKSNVTTNEGEFTGHFTDPSEKFNICLTDELETSDAESLSLESLTNLHLGLFHLSRQQYKSSLEHFENLPEKCLSASAQCYLKYAKAFAEFHNTSYSQARVELENDATASDDTVDLCTARLFNLRGCLYATENKPHSAVQMFKESLKADFGLTLAMYNIALQYQTLGLIEAELETLRLLVNVLEASVSEPLEPGLGRNLNLCYSQSGVTISPSQTAPRIPTEEALYALCRRCLDLQRYDLATQKYMKLITLLTDFTSMRPDAMIYHHILSIPPLQQVYLECILCLLQSEQPEEAITFCDRLLERCPAERCPAERCTVERCTTLQQEQDDPSMSSQAHHIHKNGAESSDIGNNTKSEHPVEDPVTTSSAQDQSEEPKSRKRSRSEGSCHSDTGAWNDSPNSTSEVKPRLIALMYKADALLLQEKPHEALLCLDRILSEIGSIHVAKMHQSAEVIEQKVLTPLAKRVKLDFEPSQVPENNLTQGNADWTTEDVLFQVYVKKSVLLVGVGDMPKAQQTSRMALLIMPGDGAAVYNHCLILTRLGRQPESVRLWLRYRGVGAPMDTFQLEKMIKMKQNNLRLVKENEEATSGLTNPVLNNRTCLMMDLWSLRWQMNHRKL